MRKTVSLTLFIIFISALIYAFVPSFSVFGVDIEKLDLFSDLLSVGDSQLISENEDTKPYSKFEENNSNLNSNTEITEETKNNYFKLYDKDSVCLLKNFLNH